MATVALMLAACGVVGAQASLMERIVAVESGGAVYAIKVNGDFELVRQPNGKAEAQAMARWLLKHGHSFDAGLAQVNSANFVRLGLTMELLFDPCTNLGAGLRVLAECQARAADKLGVGKGAEAAALSCYNTGHLERGIQNGYVAAVQRAAGGGRALPPTRRPPEGREDDETVGGLGGEFGALGTRPLDVFGQGAAKQVNRQNERKGT